MPPSVITQVHSVKNAIRYILRVVSFRTTIFPHCIHADDAKFLLCFSGGKMQVVRCTNESHLEKSGDPVGLIKI